MACCTGQTNCNHIITIGYLKSFVGNDIQDANGNVVSVNHSDDTYCPTYAELTGGSLIPNGSDKGNGKWSQNVDGIIVGGSYASNQCVKQEDLSAIYTRFESFSITATPNTNIDECGNQTSTMSYTYMLRKYNKAMNSSCEVNTTSSTNSDTASTVSYTPSDNWARISNSTVSFDKNGTVSSSTRTVVITGSVNFRGTSHIDTENITQNGLGGTYLFWYSTGTVHSYDSVSLSQDTFGCDGGSWTATGRYTMHNWDVYRWRDNCGVDYNDHTEDRNHSYPSGTENAGNGTVDSVDCESITTTYHDSGTVNYHGKSASWSQTCEPCKTCSCDNLYFYNERTEEFSPYDHENEEVAYLSSDCIEDLEVYTYDTSWLTPHLVNGYKVTVDLDSAGSRGRYGTIYASGTSNGETCTVSMQIEQNGFGCDCSEEITPATAVTTSEVANTHAKRVLIWKAKMGDCSSWTMPTGICSDVFLTLGTGTTLIDGEYYYTISGQLRKLEPGSDPVSCTVGYRLYSSRSDCDYNYSESITFTAYAEEPPCNCTRAFINANTVTTSVVGDTTHDITVWKVRSDCGTISATSSSCSSKITNIGTGETIEDGSRFLIVSAHTLTSDTYEYCTIGYRVYSETSALACSSDTTTVTIEPWNPSVCDCNNSVSATAGTTSVNGSSTHDIVVWTVSHTCGSISATSSDCSSKFVGIGTKEYNGYTEVTAHTNTLSTSDSDQTCEIGYIFISDDGACYDKASSTTVTIVGCARKECSEMTVTESLHRYLSYSGESNVELASLDYSSCVSDIQVSADTNWISASTNVTQSKVFVSVPNRECPTTLRTGNVRVKWSVGTRSCYKDISVGQLGWVCPVVCDCSGLTITSAPYSATPMSSSSHSGLEIGEFTKDSCITSYTVTTNDTWIKNLTVSEHQGYHITANFDENTATTENSGTVTINYTAGTTSCSAITFTVKQAAASPTPSKCDCDDANFSIRTGTVSEDSSAHYIQVPYTSTCGSVGAVVTTSGVDWITNLSTYGGNIGFIMNNNPGSQRQAVIRVSHYSGSTVSGLEDCGTDITVTQYAASPSCSCSDANIRLRDTEVSFTSNYSGYHQVGYTADCGTISATTNDSWISGITVNSSNVLIWVSRNYGEFRAGNVFMTVNGNTCGESILVTQESPSCTCSSLKVSGTSYDISTSINAGDSLDIDYNIGCIKTGVIMWSSDFSVASITDHDTYLTISGVAPGTADITLTFYADGTKCVRTITVTVTQAPGPEPCTCSNLELSPTSFNFGASTSLYGLGTYAPTDCLIRVVSKPNWVTVGLNLGELRVTAESNTSSSDRDGEIIFSIAGTTCSDKKILVYQDGAETPPQPGMTLCKLGAYLDGEGHAYGRITNSGPLDLYFLIAIDGEAIEHTFIIQPNNTDSDVSTQTWSGTPTILSAWVYINGSRQDLPYDYTSGGMTYRYYT